MSKECRFAGWASDFAVPAHFAGEGLLGVRRTRRHIAQSIDEVLVSFERGSLKLQIHSGIAWRQQSGNAAIRCGSLKCPRHDGEETGVGLVDELPISLNRFVACS